MLSISTVVCVEGYADVVELDAGIISGNINLVSGRTRHSFGSRVNQVGESADICEYFDAVKAFMT